MSLDERLRERLAALADTLEPAELTDHVVTVGRRRRRRRRAGAVAGSAAVVAAVVAGSVLVADGGGGSHPPVIAAPAPTPTHNTDPLDAAFHVAAPELDAPSGPIGERQPPCRPADISARGEMRATADGVVGVVHMVGHRCSLIVYPGPDQLLDAAGNPLAVRSEPDLTTLNPPRNGRPDLGLAAGQSNWGFAWRGSWCGARAAAVVVPLAHDPRDLVAHLPASYGNLVVPLTGPMPRCQGPQSSVLVIGVPGDGDQGVLPTPADAAGLQVQLSVPRRVSGGLVAGLALILHNTTRAPIVLDPSPDYVVKVADVTRFGSEFGIRVVPLPGPVTVPAGGRVQVPLEREHYAEGAPPGQEPPSGTTISVTVAIAGVPSATAKTRVA